LPKKLRAIGVHREAAKAGKPEADRAILRAAIQQLRRHGFSVRVRHPQKLRGTHQAALILSMARSPEAHAVLRKLQEKGALVINNPNSVAFSLNRAATYNALKEEGIPIPTTTIKTLSSLPKSFRGKVILKRPDRHEFTRIVSNANELREAISFYRKQGLRRIVVQAFVDGQHVKFYGIGNEIFVPEELERRASAKIIKRIKEVARKSGACIGLQVFGGDIVLKDGIPYLVDLNDWPSFSSIRELAAEKIAVHAKGALRG
jgi:glutathione synthase/RimK-type ligase-like ATP-grasp enzyme